MTPKATRLVRVVFDWGLVLSAGTSLGLLVVWLKTAYGVSPYWFVGVGTGLALVALCVTVRFLTIPRGPVFVLDWVLSVEGLLAFAMLSVFGLVALAGLVWGGITLLVIFLALLCLALGTVSYVLKHAPLTTWDDDADV